MALACIVAGLGGLMSFQEGKRVKKFEGIPVKEEEVLADVERGVVDGEKRKQKGGKKEDEAARVEENKSSAPEIDV